MNLPQASRFRHRAVHTHEQSGTKVMIGLPETSVRSAEWRRFLGMCSSAILACAATARAASPRLPRRRRAVVSTCAQDRPTATLPDQAAVPAVLTTESSCYPAASQMVHARHCAESVAVLAGQAHAFTTFDMPREEAGALKASSRRRSRHLLAARRVGRSRQARNRSRAACRGMNHMSGSGREERRRTGSMLLSTPRFQVEEFRLSHDSSLKRTAIQLGLQILIRSASTNVLNAHSKTSANMEGEAEFTIAAEAAWKKKTTSNLQFQDTCSCDAVAKQSVSRRSAAELEFQSWMLQLRAGTLHTE
eukprot:CAMPEP_0178445856 /NCGR_PEP_ID=MMETSP0689_2-20121128/40433_1 /TAXON_ID=160604 /ORGANISM="Amphidinium massartii, Strain CS-259" /LENGTH=304 /DNA_ID=CAMNT_0020070521 /DNA_START=99 /DNA_END=1015 /DNA_ORIENTATION=-